MASRSGTSGKRPVVQPHDTTGRDPSKQSDSDSGTGPSTGSEHKSSYVQADSHHGSQYVATQTGTSGSSQPSSQPNSGDEASSREEPGVNDDQDVSVVASIEHHKEEEDGIWEEDPDPENLDKPRIFTSSGVELTTAGIVIKNLSQRINVPSLQRWLEMHGYPVAVDCVRCIHVPCHVRKGRARGYAIVGFADRELTKQAFEYFDGLELEPGRPLRIQPAWRDSESAQRSDLSGLKCPPNFVPVRI